MFEDIRVVIVILESLLACLIGTLFIATHDNELDTVTWKKIPILLSILGIVALMISISVKSSSFRYLNISSFTIIIIALIHCTINPRKFHLNTKKLALIGGCFFAISLLVMNPNCDTSLEKITIAGYEQSGNDISLDIRTTLCQKETNATDICVGMIFLEGRIDDSTEYIKIVDFLKKNGESILDWHVNLPTKNEEHTLYFLVWSELGEKQYKIKIPRDIKVGDSLLLGDPTFIEYLRIFIFKFKKLIL